ncbi:MAG: phosphatase PAP2 family protein [Deltaproteobacteria bacterium]|nr:phosphatase PAP2 family protein [Deltaproteobacteria bacterium]
MPDTVKIKDRDKPAGGGGADAARSAFWDMTFHIGPDLLIMALFLVALAVVMLVYGGTFTFVQSSIILPLVFLVGLIVVAFGARIRRILSGNREQRREFARLSLAMVRDWSPLIVIIFIYENAHDLTDLIRPITVDASLRRADEILFGVEPTLTLQAITTPWLTEFMTFAYALYFAYPAIILGRAYGRGEFFLFREIGLALSLCFYLGLAGYITVPAIGPRCFMAAEFAVPLDGIWLTARAAAAWNHLESIKRDCFPSLHTAITTIALVYLWRLRGAWRGGRTVFWICVPLIASLWLSTVYLRYHWIVDVFAGWALAFLCCHAAPRIVRRYYRKKTGVEPAVSLDAGRAPGGT